MTEEEFEFEEQGEEEPNCFVCSCCGNVQSEAGMGNGCDGCGMFNVMDEERL